MFPLFAEMLNYKLINEIIVNYRAKYFKLHICGPHLMVIIFAKLNIKKDRESYVNIWFLLFLIQRYSNLSNNSEPEIHINNFMLGVFPTKCISAFEFRMLTCGLKRHILRNWNSIWISKNIYFVKVVVVRYRLLSHGKWKFINIKTLFIKYALYVVPFPLDMFRMRRHVQQTTLDDNGTQ